MPIGRDQMQEGPVPFPAGDDVRARVPGEQPAELRRVACDRGCKDAAIAARPSPSRLEYTPAREAILQRHGVLGLAQLCRRRCLAVFLSQWMWGWSGSALSIEHLLPLRPASAALGQERRRYRRWLRAGSTLYAD